MTSRYLFAQVHFDAAALGPKPEAPTKPEALTAEEANQEPEAPADAGATENANKADPKKAHEAAMAKFQIDNSKFEADLRSYEEKVKTGEALVKDLNRRFAEWYYAVSGDSFENLRQGRKTLVKAKATPAAKADAQPTDAQPAEEQ